MKYFNHCAIFCIVLTWLMILYFPIRVYIEWPDKELSEKEYYELYILNKKHPKIFDLKIQLYQNDKKITHKEFEQLKRKAAGK